jgi:TfoX-like protein
VTNSRLNQVTHASSEQPPVEIIRGPRRAPTALPVLHALAATPPQSTPAGLAFLLNGNMSVSASRNGGLLVRIDPADTDASLARPHVALMEMGGRTMEGWITVAPEGLKTKRELAAWVKRSLAFVKTLPPK